MSTPQRLRDGFDRLSRHLARAEDLLLAVLLLGLMGLSTLQIGRRMLFNDGWVDSELVGRNLVLWIAVLGALAATRERRHVAIDLWASLTEGRLRRWQRRLANLLATVGCSLLTQFAWGLLQLERETATELLPGLPNWWVVSVIPIGFALMTLRFALHSLGPEPAANAAS